VSIRNRSGDSPANCLHVIPAWSVTSMKTWASGATRWASESQRELKQVPDRTAARKQRSTALITLRQPSVERCSLIGRDIRRRGRCTRSVPFLEFFEQHCFFLCLLNAAGPAIAARESKVCPSALGKNSYHVFQMHDCQSCLSPAQCEFSQLELRLGKRRVMLCCCLQQLFGTCLCIGIPIFVLFQQQQGQFDFERCPSRETPDRLIESPPRMVSHSRAGLCSRKSEHPFGIIRIK